MVFHVDIDDCAPWAQQGPVKPLQERPPVHQQAAAAAAAVNGRAAMPPPAPSAAAAGGKGAKWAVCGGEGHEQGLRALVQLDTFSTGCAHLQGP